MDTVYRKTPVYFIIGTFCMCIRIQSYLSTNQCKGGRSRGRERSAKNKKKFIQRSCNTPVRWYTGILLHYRPHDNKLNACRQCRHVGADMPTVPTCRADSADTADSDDKCRHICRRVGTVGTVGSKCRHNNWQLGLPSTLFYLLPHLLLRIMMIAYLKCYY